LTVDGAPSYTVSMPAKTRFNHHPKSAAEVLSMLLGKTEDAWGTLEDGFENSGVAEGGANSDLEKELTDWYRGQKDDATAAMLLPQLVALHEDAHGCIDNAMSVGHVHSLSWLKNAREFSDPAALKSAPPRYMNTTARDAAGNEYAVRQEIDYKKPPRPERLAAARIPEPPQAPLRDADIDF
jgi:hypothetical protein